jgi:hypothetical protein
MNFLRNPYSVRKVVNRRRKFDNGNKRHRKSLQHGGCHARVPNTAEAIDRDVEPPDMVFNNR